jgi:methylglutaconyl-CoA hydratase
MTDSSVSLSTDARGVATVQLNRAAKHNAFDDAVIAELDAAFGAIAAQQDLRAVVLAATGKSFSAGADRGWMQRMASYSHAENLQDARALAEMLRKLKNLPQPTLARVQGASYGGGVGLVSCCDLAIGTPQASFCLSEVKIGLMPATIAPYVIAAIGQRATLRYSVTAEVMSAATALELGLLSSVVAAEELDAAVEAMLDTLLANGPAAMQAAKQLMNELAGRAIDADLIETTCKAIADIRVSPEGQDGLQAFLNKQTPNWRQDRV